MPEYLVWSGETEDKVHHWDVSATRDQLEEMHRSLRTFLVRRTRPLRKLERMKGLKYVGDLLDVLCERFHMDPITTWRAAKIAEKYRDFRPRWITGLFDG